jgi:hypothetical protein
MRLAALLPAHPACYAVAAFLTASAAPAQQAAPAPASAPAAASAPAPRSTSDSAPGMPTMAAQKSASRVDAGGFYSTIELRHHVNTYYDAEGYLAKREPSLHARLQFGTQLYSGLIDTYATLGVYKLPSTQQVLQRRPELAVDVYPVRNSYFTLLQYNFIQLPFEKPDEIDARRERESSEDEKTTDTVDGTIYTIGFAPTVHWPLALGASTLELKTGLDAWTRLYSRRQYTGDFTDEMAEDDGEDRLGLDPEGSDPDGAEGEPIEDYAMHYQTQYMAGFAFKPSFVPGLTSELTANHNSRFDPRYTRDEEGAVDYEYSASRYSYYRWRLQYEITPRVALINDFYHFHEGFFEGKRQGDDRRFRNIARITCRL